MRSVNLAVLGMILLLSVAAKASAAPKYNMSGKVVNGSGYSVLLVQKNGTSKSVSLGASGAFSFKKLTLSQLNGASLQLVSPDGQYAGPVVLNKKGSKVSITFSGKAKNSSSFTLGKINLYSGYGSIKSALHSVVYSKPRVPAVNGKPVGAGELGLVDRASVTSRAVAAASSGENPGADVDQDGIPDMFDADDDGDLVLDGADPDSRGQDVPYTFLGFDFRKTLNANVRSGLSDEVIDAAVSGENVFALTFFYSLPQGSPIDGGYVVCDDSLSYCRKDTPLAYYGGISESTDEFRNHPWSELLNADGYPRMEKIRVGGSFDAVVASIQPRVGRDQFRAGDVYQVKLTNGTSVVSTRSLALSPYFVSIPAIKEYDAGSGTVQVDYDSVTPESGSIPGVSPGDPIVLTSEGNLTLTFWRPQRQAIRSDESGYYDWGNLHYGLVIEDAQATCGGYYSNVSSDLVADDTPLGTGDSPFASSGANLRPYTDSQGDRAADPANTLSFTVNLKDCLQRAGQNPGTYRVNIGAAGEDVTGGQSSATQIIFVQIP